VASAAFAGFGSTDMTVIASQPFVTEATKKQGVSSAIAILIVSSEIIGSGALLGFLRKFGADLTGLLRFCVRTPNLSQNLI
jgi:hypothetical protein